MTKSLAAALTAVGFLLSTSAFAWSENGHQTVGAIADVLIQGTNAEVQVKAILGTAGGQQLLLQTVAVPAKFLNSSANREASNNRQGRLQ